MSACGENKAIENTKKKNDWERGGKKKYLTLLSYLYIYIRIAWANPKAKSQTHRESPNITSIFSPYRVLHIRHLCTHTHPYSGGYRAPHPAKALAWFKSQLDRANVTTATAIRFWGRYTSGRLVGERRVRRVVGKRLTPITSARVGRRASVLEDNARNTPCPEITGVRSRASRESIILLSVSSVYGRWHVSSGPWLHGVKACLGATIATRIGCGVWPTCGTPVNVSSRRSFNWWPGASFLFTHLIMWILPANICQLFIYVNL